MLKHHEKNDSEIWYQSICDIFSVCIVQGWPSLKVVQNRKIQENLPEGKIPFISGMKTLQYLHRNGIPM